MADITPLTDTQIKNIVNNVVAACKDINKLNRTGYGFINLASGFIAHYDLYGFIDFYTNEESLRDDILRFQSRNQWENFRPGEANYTYYKSKQKCYNMICEKLQGI